MVRFSYVTVPATFCLSQVEGDMEARKKGRKSFFILTFLGLPTGCAWISPPGCSSRSNFPQQRWKSVTSTAVDLFWREVDEHGFVEQSHHRSEFQVPPIILLHGLLGSSRNFGTWARDLKAHGFIEPERRLFLADLRNHGDSPHAPSMTYDDMASDVEKMIHNIFDTCGCMVDGSDRSAVLVGHSMGGKVAMATAL